MTQKGLTRSHCIKKAKRVDSLTGRTGKMMSEKCLLEHSFSGPEFVEEPRLLQFVKESPIDKVLWLDFFGSRIDLTSLIDDRLQGFHFEFQSGLHHFDLFVVSRVQDFAVADA